MIERLLQRVLTEGFQKLTDNPGLIRAIFSMRPAALSSDEIDEVVRVFKAYRLTVKQNFTPLDAAFPMIAIILGGEPRSDYLVGDDPFPISEAFAESIGQRDLKTATITRYIGHFAYRIQIAAVGNPDITLYYYYAARAILFGYRLAFEANNVMVSEIRGYDMPPIQREKLPEWIYVRELAFMCRSEVEMISDIGFDLPPPIYPIIASITHHPDLEESSNG